jgi:hypothetical protein
MESPNVEVKPTSKGMIVAGWIVGLLPSAMVLMGATMGLMKHPMAVEGWKQMGISERAGLSIAVAALVSTLLYLIPPTAVLGAILLTGYLGGAVYHHVRAGDSMLMAVVCGVLLWLGLYLRDGRVRALVPLRKR